MELNSTDFLQRNISVSDLFKCLKKLYPTEIIPIERQLVLNKKMKKYGYIPYSYVKAEKELSNSEVLYCLEKKLEKEGVLKNGQFVFEYTSVLARNKETNASWIQKEGHDIKLIDLIAFGSEKGKQNTGIFMNWLRQLVILPTGNKQNHIYNTTVYLVPFHQRAFKCAYIPNTIAVNPALEDKYICKTTGLDADGQVRLFIQLVQLAGHPVIYDILPQTGRFSKMVMVNPECVRWYDVKELIRKLCISLDMTSEENGGKVLSKKLFEKYPHNEIINAINLYKKILNGEDVVGVSSICNDIIDDIENDEELINYKKYICNEMQKKEYQETIQARVKKLICEFVYKQTDRIRESDIIDREKAELLLIDAGLWTIPGGAWCSAGVPVFDKMSKKALYPEFKHYDYSGRDVSEYSNLDCQAPFYFVYLENGEINEKVVSFFINYAKYLQKKFNFDGFRVDHCDRVVDEYSEQNGVPISYRVPAQVLKRLNFELKKDIPYFASIAEYMLMNGYLKEYGIDMGFDVLWGNDIVSQSEKTPAAIYQENLFISRYNLDTGKNKPISVLKTYNNQDGEYKFIDRYPGQLEKEGALFKWFKYKFFPGGEQVQRPVLYVDGDESFTNGGIEKVICKEMPLKRGNDEDFYARFDAIDRFVKDNKIICEGMANIVRQEPDCFILWQILNPVTDSIILVAANYQSPKEKFLVRGNIKKQYKYNVGTDVIGKVADIPPEFVVVSEYKFNGVDYVEEEFSETQKFLLFDILRPGEFRFFNLKRKNSDN